MAPKPTRKCAGISKQSPGAASTPAFASASHIGRASRPSRSQGKQVVPPPGGAQSRTPRCSSMNRVSSARLARATGCEPRDDFGRVRQRMCADGLGQWRAGNREVAAHVEQRLAAARIAIDEPADAQARNRQRLGEVAEHDGVGQRAGAGRGPAEVQRVIHLVDDERNAARGQRFGELALLGRRHHRTRRVVRRVDEYRARAGIHGRQHAIRGLRKALRAVAASYSRTPSPQARASTGTAGYTGVGTRMDAPGSANRQVSAMIASDAPVIIEHIVRLDPVQRSDPLAQ